MITTKEQILNRVYLTDYLLGKEEFTRSNSNSRDSITNKDAFLDDFRDGRLKRYAGENVVYCDGIRCGHSTNRALLYKEAIKEYNDTNIAVFRVPNEDEEEPDLLDAIGKVD